MQRSVNAINDIRYDILEGVMVTAQRGQEIKARNVSHFRKVITEAMPLPHLTGELDHVPRQPDEPDPAPPITTDVHPPQPASPVGNPVLCFLSYIRRLHNTYSSRTGLYF